MQNVKKILMYIVGETKKNQEIKALLDKNRPFLYSGKYRIVGETKKIAYLKNDDAILFIDLNEAHLSRGDSNCNSLKQKIKKMINKIITQCSIVTIKSDDRLDHFKGSLVMFTREQDVKIFNFKRDEILNILKDKNKYDLIKSAYMRFNKHFDIPIKEFNDEMKMFIEDYIDFKAFYLWTNDEKNNIISSLLKSVSGYLKEHDSKALEIYSVNSLLLEFQEKTNHFKLKNKINEILYNESFVDKQIFLAVQHGDLNFNNLLLTKGLKGKYFVIDWEECNHYVFFYDVFNLICVEYLYQRNSELLTSYIYGVYDYELTQIFKNVGLAYDFRRKKSYLAIYIMERILKYELIKNKSYTPDFSERCLMLINEVENIEKRIENSEMIK